MTIDLLDAFANGSTCRGNHHGIEWGAYYEPEGRFFFSFEGESFRLNRDATTRDEAEQYVLDSCESRAREKEEARRGEAIWREVQHTQLMAGLGEGTGHPEAVHLLWESNQACTAALAALAAQVQELQAQLAQALGTLKAQESRIAAIELRL